MTTVNEPQFFVVIHRPGSERRIPLICPRTRDEIVKLEEKGYVVDTFHEERRSPAQKPLQTAFGEALLVVSRLHVQAEEEGNADIAKRAELAVKELLAGSGVDLGETRSSARMPVARRRLEVPLQGEERTIPGLGGRR
jgi:hypothetical protein